VERRYVQAVDRLLAVDPSNGKLFTILEWQRVFESVQSDGQHTRSKGFRSFRLESGASVNYVDSETFRVADTGHVLRKVR
jgi:hypothetical protein